MNMDVDLTAHLNAKANANTNLQAEDLSTLGHEDSELAERLNSDCQCVSLDTAALLSELHRLPDGAALAAMITADRPNLFSGSVVFVNKSNVQRMAAVIAAIEQVVSLPAYREHVLSYAPESGRHVTGAHGVFLGYDFHLGVAGPQLIEINTNAGGALLNALLARAQNTCCDAARVMLPGALAQDYPEHLFLKMFLDEWRAERGDAPLKTIAIVDSEPEGQYLYPEFVLFQHLFQRHGIVASICDPSQLSYRDDALWLDDTRIDLVYNRLTDFALAQPVNAPLAAAWLAGAAVVTPHPAAHALYADKRNLIALSDARLLTSWGVDAATALLLSSAIPATERVDAARADEFWSRRRQLFFKPVQGYGSKAAYRGDKLTRRVFDEILNGGYVAQALVQPTSRRLAYDGVPVHMKLDLRNYVYRGDVQLISARLWRGQTSNFRTPGGGFAPVLAVPDKDDA
jgi:hypothetical protein